MVPPPHLAHNRGRWPVLGSMLLLLLMMMMMMEPRGRFPHLAWTLESSLLRSLSHPEIIHGKSWAVEIWKR